jgi:hypothetical protein
MTQKAWDYLGLTSNVLVLRVKGLNLPFPRQTTVMTCTLNNGIHFVTTPECNLEKNCQIEQEFEL